MILASDITNCDDCGQRRAVLPAKVCFSCQIPRMQRVIDTYERQSIEVRNARKKQHQEQTAQNAKKNLTEQTALL